MILVKETISDRGTDWDKLAPSEDRAMDFAAAYINPNPPKMLNRNTYSPEYRLAHYGELYNSILRKEFPKPEVEPCIRVMEARSCKKDLVLYRGVEEGIYKMIEENARNHKRGDIDLYEKGFTSCSLVKGKEKKCRKRLRIYVPKGSHVVFIGSANDEPTWYEVVIQCGALMRIVSEDEEYTNCILVGTGASE